MIGLQRKVGSVCIVLEGGELNLVENSEEIGESPADFSTSIVE